MTKKRTEKDKYFIKRINFINEIKRAIVLADEWKYEESNKIYNQLLTQREDEDIKEYLDSVFANKWWNFIELWLYKKALECFTIGEHFNPSNELIKEWIAHIEEHVKMMGERIDNYDKKHDFQLLRWPHPSLKDPNKLLQDLWFDNYKDFLYWLSDEFTKEWRQFRCWSCCRSLLPEFVTISEKESGKKLIEIIKENRNTYSIDQQEMIKSNYKHYFCRLAPLGKPIRTKMWKELDNRINSKE